MLRNLFKKAAKPTDEAEMSFLEHIEALRSHLFRSAVYVFICALAIFFQKTFVFDTVILGPSKSNFITYRLFCKLSELTCIHPEGFQLITRELSEQLVVHIKASFFLGLIIAFPLVFWEFWKFVKPGLYEKERKATAGVVLWCSLLFLVGVLFGYFILAPFSIAFLASYEVSSNVENTATLTSYVDSMAMFTMLTGLVFEMPLVIYFLSKLGIIGPEFMRKNRRYAVIILAMIAAIITPPDLTSMCIVIGPLLLLYEISIHIAKTQYGKL